ncbi:kinase-like protein [Xylariaceae sp. FL1272]|nr:kinase-like protein [Xylariaceae sp. FL1272]
MPDAMRYDVLFLDQDHPDPLPTPYDIDGSEILIYESTGSRLLRVQERFLIKFGIHVHHIEGHNMLYVAKSTMVPVPKVYAMYQRQGEQGVVTYIVMQFLQPPGYFGDIAGGPPLDDIFSLMPKTHSLKTSLTTEDELIDCIICAYSLETGDRMAYKTRYYQHVLPTVLRGNGSSVFTNNDFQRKNVLVQPDGTLVIIDWEFASWYPIYWEYSTATYAHGDWKDDWHEYICMVLDEYPTQSLWLSSMKNEMWF